MWVLWHLTRLSPPDRYAVWGGFTLLLTVLHLRRRDAGFCRLFMERPWRLFAVEYLVCFAPLVALAAAAAAWDCLVLYIIGAVGVGLLPTRRRASRPGWLPSVLGVTSLELTSFLRRNLISLALLSAVALALCAVPVASMAVLLAQVLVLSGAYDEHEPLDMVLLPEISARRYLWRRVWAGVSLFLKLNALTLMLYVALNPATAWLPPVVAVLAAVGVALFVFTKYADYEPGRRGVATPPATALAVAGLIVPLFLPFTLLFVWQRYRTAHEVLDQYLHVYY
jgi:hypothetical protein